MKFNEYVNIGHYQLAREKNLSSRDEAYGGPSFEERYEENEVHELIERISMPPSSTILVVGTGTGADSCWLADQGYRVTGIDIVQDAVDIAKDIAKERGSSVEYCQDDICKTKSTYGKFDVIIDSFCLQSIVLDYEREKVYSFVKDHLRKGGHYLIVSAGYSENKTYNDNYIRDAETGIVYQKAKRSELELDDLMNINGAEYLPVRRHYTMAMLVNELENHGFKILYANIEEEWGALKVITSTQDVMSFNNVAMSELNSQREDFSLT